MADDVVDEFARRGWVVLRGVVPAAEVAALRAAAEALLPDGALPAEAEGVAQLVRPALRSPALRAWLATPEPFRLAARLLGASAVQLLQDALLAKAPGPLGTVAWHQDASYFGYLAPLDVVGVRLALGAETVASGCLWVLDASHRSDVTPIDTFAATRVADTLGDAGGARIAVELAPGDVSIHHARTFHASFANTTRAARRTLVTHVAAAHCRLQPERLPPGSADWFPTDGEGGLASEVFWPLPLDP